MKGGLCEQIKSRVTLHGVATLLGIDLPSRDGVKFCSPIRPDNFPSCSIKGDLYSDWSRDEHLDQIDFFAAAKDIPRAEAIRTLARIFQIIGDIPARRPAPPRRTDADERKEKQRKRDGWATFEPPTPKDIHQVAAQRGISVEGVQTAANRGLLFTVTDRGSRAWAVTDSARLNARIRRMDGGLWYGKEKSMPPTGGGQESSWPIGIHEALPFSAVTLVEGDADILAVFHLAWCGGVEDSVAVVAMLGAVTKIHEDALPLFRDKRVRIFQDDDEAGRNAAGKWAAQLQAAGACVDGFEFTGLLRADGKPVKDMNDFVHICPDQWESERETIEGAFNFVQQVNRNQPRTGA